MKSAPERANPDTDQPQPNRNITHPAKWIRLQGASVLSHSQLRTGALPHYVESPGAVL